MNPKCPYCEKKLHLRDFYVMELDKKGRKGVRGFLGEFGAYNQKFHCPFCGKILGFTAAT